MTQNKTYSAPKIALYQPDIPQKTAAIVRTSSCLGYQLEIIEPFGFFLKEPVEKKGFDGNFWVWGYPDYTRDYMVCADVARGDGKDYSAFHVIDVESMEQVAEYRGLVGTKDYGNMLVNVATEYNDALLIIENANDGWAPIQPAVDRMNKKLYYMLDLRKIR